MTFYKYIYLISGLVFSQSVLANSFLESFEGEPRINMNVYAFAADVNGTIREQNIKYHVDQPSSDTVKHLDRMYMGYLDFRKGDWGLYIDKQLVKTSKDEAVINIPIAVSTKLDQTNYGIYYRAYQSAETNQNNQHKLVVEPTIGIHHTEAKATLAAFNITKQADINWDEFFWGTRIRYNFDSPWNLASEVTFGAKDTISAHAYVGYNIPVFKRFVNLRVGYRYFKQDYESNNFQWDITQKGPVIGINLPIF